MKIDAGNGGVQGTQGLFYVSFADFRSASARNK
jgi:hypothetical protein